MAGKTGAKKKKELDPEVEAAASALARAVTSARTLDDLVAALRAVGAESEAAKEALRRLQPPFRTFGGESPEEGSNAVSWDKTRLLLVDEDGLHTARLVARRMSVDSTPPSREQACAGNDTDGEADTASSEPSEEAAAAPAAGAPHNTAAVEVELKRELEEAGETVLRLSLTQVGKAGYSVRVQLKGKGSDDKPKDVSTTLPAEVWAQPLKTLLADLVEGVRNYEAG